MSPALRKVIEPSRCCLSTILFWVVVGTVGLGAASAMLTLLKLEEVRVIFLFLPSMRSFTHVLQLTTINVSSNEIVRFPIIAHLWLVGEYWRLSSVVLPIMGVHTYLPVVVIVSVRAPDSLEMVHIEVHVNFIIFNQLNRQFFSRMSEGTKLGIFTSLWIYTRLCWTFWREVDWAELGFVLIRMVKLFYSIVS